ncbi:UNVERIFIED_CONTAM: hypothetical protein RMT77_007984 [Armadillidium vulgare]
MNPFVVFIISILSIRSSTSVITESQTYQFKMAESSNKDKLFYPNLVNDRIARNENGKTLIKTINHRTGNNNNNNNNNSRIDSTIAKSPSIEKRFNNEANFIPITINDVDQTIIKLIDNQIKAFTSSNRKKNSLSNIIIPLISQMKFDTNPGFKSSKLFMEEKRSPSNDKYKMKDLFFRAYVKEENESEEGLGLSSSEQPSNENPKHMTGEENENILQRMLKATKKYMCLLPFIRCIKKRSYQAEKTELYQDNEDDMKESASERYDDPTVIVEETCPKGKYVPDLDLCLFFVLKESRFSEAKSTCGSLVEGGDLWITDTDAKSAFLILEENKVVNGDYSAWIDGVFFEDTLVGTGHFDSQYKKWLNLGLVRGKRKSGDKIVLKSEKDDVFYTYDEGRTLHPFVCQSPPHDSKYLVWNNDYVDSEY